MRALRWARFLCLGTLFTAVAISANAGESLRGSRASLDRQNHVARQHDYTYLVTGKQVSRFVRKGWLVPVRPSRDVALHGVSFPYARPEVELFVRRLGAQYRAACGERLVVTSLTRPTTRQPRNASDRSVHPTGMAMDLRYSRNRNCRRWIERVLIDLERAGVLEATRERRPIHYHVALFPKQYVAYLDRIQEPTLTADAESDETSSDRLAYTVQSGDSLWTIARTHSTTVRDLRRVNSLRGNRIMPGQVLEVPGGG